MEFMEFSAKTVQDAITNACQHFTVASDSLEYEVVEEGSSGFLGFNAKPAVIKARVLVKEADLHNLSNFVSGVLLTIAIGVTLISGMVMGINFMVQSVEDKAKDFLKDVLASMNIPATVEATYSEEEKTLEVVLNGEDMGVLIGKRGQTLDSLQYLVSLVVNKGTSEYIRVKVDTENYRERRKLTLENLAKNIAFKVKRTKRSVSLEPMNPYERRIIHSALQNDKYVTTHSEGEEPFRKVVVSLKK